MKIAIIGVGAMGCLFGSYLAQKANVTLIGSWAAQIEALNHKGLARTDPDGQRSHHNLKAVHIAAARAPFDLVLLLVKAPQTRRAARQAALLGADSSYVLSLQNGIGNRELIASSISEEQILIGTTAQGATLTAPGQLFHAGHGQTFVGIAAGTESIGAEFSQLLSSSGLPTQTTEQIAPLLWQKCAVNAGINPLTALLNCPNGVLLGIPQVKNLMFAAAEETSKVAAAQGIQLPTADIKTAVAVVAEATANNYSSMWQDIQRGAQTEIMAICGAVVHFGQQLRVPTPVNQLLLTAMQDLETGRLVFPRGQTTEQRFDFLRLNYSNFNNQSYI